MATQIIPVDEFDYVVFGGTGDLSSRKLIPALFKRFVDGQLIGDFRIIGASRAGLSDEDFRIFAKDSVESHVAGGSWNAESLDGFLQHLHYCKIDAMSEAGWLELKELLGNSNKIRAFYLAVGPSLFGEISQRLSKHGLVNDNSRLVIEKPIGHDLESAQALNEAVGSSFKEEQIFRIDHYLGKETVQNLMALRFANALFEPLWNSAHIDHVQITVAETLGVEGRGNYYNKSGAIRDMLQNHLLQLLCLAAMEPPSSLDADAVRDEKLKVLKSLKPITVKEVAETTIRGQYVEGAVGTTAVKGYLDEIDDEQSDTETFVAIKAEIQNWRWAGVPFYLRTGKRLGAKVSEIVIQFKPVPHNVFAGAGDKSQSNRLVIRLQPDEGVKQWIMIKDPGPGGMRLRHVPLDMSFAESFDVKAPDAYERLLLDVVRNNATLFMRRDEVEAAWKWVDPIIHAWVENSQKPLPYRAGSWGPTAAIALIERDGRTWVEDH